MKSFLNKKIVKYLLLVLLSIFLIVSFLGDWNNINSREYTLANKALQNKFTNNVLYITLNEIDPNLGLAKLDFSFTTIDPKVITDKEIKISMEDAGVLYADYSQGFVPLDPMFLNTKQIQMKDPSINFFNGANIATFENKNIEIPIKVIGNKSIFPLDTYQLKKQFLLYDKNNKFIGDKLTIVFLSKDSRFIYSSPTIDQTSLKGTGEMYQTLKTLQDLSIDVTFKRSNSQILLTFTFSIICMIIVIWSIVKIIKSETGEKNMELLMLNLTLLISLPSFRALIVPNNLTFAPLFDFFTVVAWLCALSFSLIYMYKDRFN